MWTSCHQHSYPETAFLLGLHNRDFSQSIYNCLEPSAFRPYPTLKMGFDQNNKILFVTRERKFFFFWKNLANFLRVSVNLQEHMVSLLFLMCWLFGWTSGLKQVKDFWTELKSWRLLYKFSHGDWQVFYLKHSMNIIDSS